MARDELLSPEDEKEVRLFSEIIDLEPARRHRLMRALHAYELAIADEDDELPGS